MHKTMVRIEKLLKAQDKDWGDFAQLLGVQKQHINNWKNRGISKNKAIEAAKKLGTSVDIILCDEAHGVTTAVEFKQSPASTSQVAEDQPAYPTEQVALNYNLLEDCIEDIEAATIMLEEPLSPKLKSRAIAALYQHRLENGMLAMPNDVGLAMSIISSLGS
jgi:hypothetical protein